MDLLGQDGSIQQTWPFFYDWKNTNRRLVVIDEALDIVEHSQAALEGLRLTEATLSPSIRTRFTLEVQCLKEVIDLLDTYEKRTRKEKVKEKFSKGWKHALIAGEEIYWTGIVNGEPTMRTVNPLYFDYDSAELDSDAQELLQHQAAWLKQYNKTCLLYTSPSPRDLSTSRKPTSA